MTGEAKDLAYYEEHPEEATIEVLEQLANANMGESQPAGEPAKQDEAAEDSAAAEAESASVASDAATEKGEGTKADEAAPIASRDGKHTIPFSVLENERKARQQAETMVSDLNERIAQLQSQAETGERAADAGHEPAISADDLEALRADFPAFAKVIEAQMGKIAQLETQVSTVSSREAERQAEVQRTTQEQVRDAIDASPKLLKLEADPEAWETVVEIDKAFRAKPEFRDLSFAQRFEKVVQRYEAVHGPVDVPAAQNKSDSVSAKDKAAALLKEKGDVTPRSLSDLPGGLPDAGSEAERAENMSAIDMGLMMQNMTPAQIDAYLNKL